MPSIKWEHSFRIDNSKENFDSPNKEVVEMTTRLRKRQLKEKTLYPILKLGKVDVIAAIAAWNSKLRILDRSSIEECQSLVGELKLPLQPTWKHMLPTSGVAHKSSAIKATIIRIDAPMYDVERLW
jgi:hypothetical protein